MVSLKEDLDIDVMIDFIWAMQANTRTYLREKQIRILLARAMVVLLQQPMLLHIRAPINICGDIHGHLHELLRIFKYAGDPITSSYLFLGDYVDRGKMSVETMCLLLAYKLKFPDTFFLLRGNHECEWVNQNYSFYDECKRKYNTKIFKTFTDCFNCMPVAAVIEKKIFCCHGGLSPELTSLNAIRDIARPVDVPRHGLMCDLLWSDPDKTVQNWELNGFRGISYLFGEEVVYNFLSKFKMDLVCRAHQIVDGYEFFANRKLVTIFSTPDYCKYSNDGAVMVVGADLRYRFLKFESRRKAAEVWTTQTAPREEEYMCRMESQQQKDEGCDVSKCSSSKQNKRCAK